MERWSYTWFVVYYKYTGKDGRKYFCVLPKRYSNGDNLVLIAKDDSVWRISPYKTRKDAITMADVLNRMYERNGDLATTDNLTKEEV